MDKIKIIIAAILILLAAAAIFLFSKTKVPTNNGFVSYTVDPKQQEIKLYYKNDMNENFSSIQNLKLWLEKKNQKLIFAMNAGMYKADHSPQGLYIENNILLSPIDTSGGNGNFYLRPNGIFYITVNNEAVICNTINFPGVKNIKYATQSGPMLVIDGQIHPAFQQSSTNLNVRNGVGILPGGKVVFAMSEKPVNFYDFAMYFKSLGCKNALYLDGLVSRTFLPAQNWIQTDGDFGVIIGITEND